MRKKELNTALDLGIAVAIMSTEGRFSELYEIINEKLGVGGYVDTAYTMSWFATEALAKYDAPKVDWEKVIDAYYNSNQRNGLPLISEKFKNRDHGTKLPLISCWDEALEDYAQWKIENFTYEEFNRINSNPNKINPLLSDELDSGGIEIGDEVEIMCINDFQSMKYNLGNTFKVRAIADVGSDNSLYVSEDLVTWFHPIDLKIL